MRTLKIAKVNGSYHKTIRLPVNTRILKQDGQAVVLRLDSIGNGYFYGNKGKDSVAFGDIKIVNLRGLKEAIKYTALGACVAITIGATYFTIYAFNYPVVKHLDNEPFKYVGMAYMTIFASLGTTVYLYPKTRFTVSKYEFRTDK